LDAKPKEAALSYFSQFLVFFLFEELRALSPSLASSFFLYGGVELGPGRS